VFGAMASVQPAPYRIPSRSSISSNVDIALDASRGWLGPRGSRKGPGLNEVYDVD
jgi:hypothetical protein